jgi:oligoendopeptidase F
MFSDLPTSALEAMSWGVEKYQPYFDKLIATPITAENVSAWLTGWTQIAELIGEVFARLSVATNQNTADEAAEKAYFAFLDTLLPAMMIANNQLQKKLVESGLSPAGFEIPLRNMRAEIELFREANIPLITEEQKLGTEFDKIIGAQTVQWQGQEVPVTELQTVGQNPDRAVRESAWRLAHGRFLQDREKINALWVKFLDLRKQMAANAGYDNYIAYRFKAMGRFDYTPDDCRAFHAAIEQVVVPATQRLFERRRAALGVDSLRPWDMNIDPTHNQSIVLDAHNRPPLKPYQDMAEMEAKAEAIFRHVDPVLGGYWATMRREKLLDLPNRKNKAPGGYCTSFPVMKRPFIFMNAVGIHDDVQTLLHEAGHAFHVFESANLPYTQLKDAPIEFCEVASMGMELLAAPYLAAEYGGYYSEADAARAAAEHLEGMLTFWPYMAVVDAFQLWVYEDIERAKNPANCDAKWAELWSRFIKGVDWSGLEQEMMTGWHRKLHIHRIPFYYVEYGLAQLGAAQVWRGALTDQAGAVAKYRKALALGGSVTLPELYAAAGAKFAFDPATLGEAVSLIEGKLNEYNAVH